MNTARERPRAVMFANRLRKNLRTLGKWARQSGVHCYRVYDADMPEYAFAIDLYESESKWACVQEYEAPESIDRTKARERREDVYAALPEVLGVDSKRIIRRTRRRQRGQAQYVPLAAKGEYHEVSEGSLRFLVNFSDYLDTGLFLDHRVTRAMICDLASGKRFLNLFAYTGTATVYAAAGGARQTTSVDLSSRYLEWARQNLVLNGLDGELHELIRADCVEWLRRPCPRPKERLYDLVFIDPPTFSRSKGMTGHFGVQRDHVELIRRATALLAPGGRILFSNNFKRFRLEWERVAQLALDIEDVTERTIPRDFKRNPRIHHCFLMRRKA